MILEGLAEYIADNIGDLTFTDQAGSTIFIETMPETDNLAVALFITGGIEADTLLPYDHPDVQIVVRADSTDPRPAITKWSEIYSLLHGLRNLVLPDGTVLISSIATQSAPVRMGTDEVGRQRYSMNLRCETRTITTHRP